MKSSFNKKILFLLFLIIGGCSCSGLKPTNYVKIADNITDKTAKKLKEQKRLYLVGTGGKMMGDIQAMDMGFFFYQEVDLKEARNLIVYVINEYLFEINNHEEIRPFLHEYPFTAKNVEIDIWVKASDGTRPSQGKIYYISASNGIINYYIRLPEEQSRKSICEETYEEALQIINSQK